MEDKIRVSTAAVRLKEALASARMKQIELARASGIDRGAISNYLAGRYVPKLDSISKMARVLNVADLWLMGYDVPKERGYILKEDDVFLSSLPPLHAKEELPPEIEALNTFLYKFGMNIMRTNGTYYLDEAGALTDDELNEILNNVAMATKNAVDIITAKRKKELFNFVNGKNKN